MTDKPWKFVHAEAGAANWAPGLRKIFEYRDLGLAAGTDGAYVAQVIRANGEDEGEQIHEWHYHECEFQMLYILKGWVTFEYEAIGLRTLRSGDCVNQLPMIRHREVEASADLELIEIVAPADFKTVTLGDSL